MVEIKVVVLDWTSVVCWEYLSVVLMVLKKAASKAGS
jgi:hypothetical protein